MTILFIIATFIWAIVGMAVGLYKTAREIYTGRKSLIPEISIGIASASLSLSLSAVFLPIAESYFSIVAIILSVLIGYPMFVIISTKGKNIGLRRSVCSLVNMDDIPEGATLIHCATDDEYDFVRKSLWEKGISVHNTMRDDFVWISEEDYLSMQE